LAFLFAFYVAALNVIVSAIFNEKNIFALINALSTAYSHFNAKGWHPIAATR
jgi:hypothetical protein